MRQNTLNSCEGLHAKPIHLRRFATSSTFASSFVSETQDAANTLIAEALEDWPPMPNLTMRANTVRLLASMWYIQGDIAFPRGWLKPAMQAFISAGVDCPNARCWRSYRSDLKGNPSQFLTTPGAPVEILRQMDLDLMGL